MNTCIACGSSRFETLVNSQDFCVTQEAFDVSRCASCGFAYTVNAPSQDQIGRYYAHEDYVSHTDTNEGLFFRMYHKVREYMLGRKKAYMENHAKVKRVFDIGAGTGYFVSYLRSCGIHAVGFEPDSNARQQAKKKFDLDLIDDIDVVLQEADSFDAVTLWHVLEHVHDLKGYFKKFNLLLKDDGLLVIAVPNYTSFDAQFYRKYWAAYDLPKHLWHFSPNSIQLLAKSESFQLIKTYPMPFDPFYIALLSEGHKQSGKLGKLRGVFIGAISFVKGWIKPSVASSVVYVFKKNLA